MSARSDGGAWWLVVVMRVLRKQCEVSVVLFMDILTGRGQRELKFLKWNDNVT